MASQPLLSVKHKNRSQPDLKLAESLEGLTSVRQTGQDWPALCSSAAQLVQTATCPLHTKQW